MTIDALLSMSVDLMESMTDAQLKEFLAPYLIVTRTPLSAETLEGMKSVKAKTTKPQTKKKAREMKELELNNTIARMLKALEGVSEGGKGGKEGKNDH